ncbi:MAG: universal stress protein [Sphingomonadales bacterium]
MKNILVLIHDDAGQEARLQAALDLTRALGGHLTCLDVARYPVTGGYFSPEAEVALLDEERHREQLNTQRLIERLGGEDVPWNIAATTGTFADCIAAEAGLADLIVVNRELDDPTAPDMLAAASSIILETRKPVIAVSEKCRGFDASGRAIVAWDGSLPAMAALTASVPLLLLAGSVNLVEIQGDSPGSVEEAAAYLSRHDIHAEVSLVARFKDDKSSIGDMIATICGNENAAYCVMGAYGHSRLREAVLGGVTRHMLGCSTVPLVLAH